MPEISCSERKLLLKNCKKIIKIDSLKKVRMESTTITTITNPVLFTVPDCVTSIVFDVSGGQGDQLIFLVVLAV